MPNVGLQQGILMYKGERIRTLESTLDMNHLMAIQAPEEATQLGTVEYWAQKRRMEQPWFQINGVGGTNIQMTGKWGEYSTPAMRDGSTRIVADLSGDVNAGRGHTPVEMEITGRAMQIGEVFKFDERMRDEFRIDNIVREAGDNQVISFTRLDSAEPINKLFLQSGNPIISLGVNVFNSEFDQDSPGWKLDVSSGPKYRIPVGQAEIRVSYHVTKDVAAFDLPGNSFQITGQDKADMDKSVEYFFEIPGLQTSDKMSTLSDAMVSPQASLVKSSLSAAAPNGSKATISIASLYDSLSVKYLNRGEQLYLLWGTGGRPFQGNGYDQKLLPVGIWQQLDTGYKTTFNIGNFGLHTLKAMFQEYIHGKFDAVQEGSEPVIEVQTGRGGYQMVQKMIEEERSTSAIIVLATDFNMIKGSGPYDLEYSPLSYSAIRVPFLAIFKFVYNPGFDNITANPISNPIIQPYGYRLSSFSMIVTPENALGSGNIKILRNKENYGGQIFMNIVNGRGVGHPLYSTTQRSGSIIATQSTDLRSGYGAYFYKCLDSAWVIDPTKVLKAVPINPYSKLTF
jgi:hypothetical protein